METPIRAFGKLVTRDHQVGEATLAGFSADRGVLAPTARRILPLRDVLVPGGWAIGRMRQIGSTT